MAATAHPSFFQQPNFERETFPADATFPSIGDKKISILIVDDNADKLHALESVLADLDQNLVKAQSGTEALRLLLREEFAVILLDVNMPIMDGFETAALIRQRKNFEHTPIIFVTAINTNETHVFKGYSLGAVDYIFTPVVPEVLRAKVAVFVELTKKREEVKWHAEQLRRIQEGEHQRKLNETQERLEVETNRNRFFTLAVDMLAIADFTGNLKQLNPTWTKVLGIAESDLKSGRFVDLVVPEDRDAMNHQLTLLTRRGQGSVYLENRCRCNDGTICWLGWTIAPFHEEALLYIFARNITERKRVEHALQETNQELESFSYTVSHDLRAPLRAMQGFAAALLQDYGLTLDETGADYARRIVTAGKRMDALIQDLLAYSRLNRSELTLEPVSLDIVILEAMAQLEGEIEETKAQVEVQKPLPWVVGHEPTLVQVFANLISNGIKFIRTGTRPLVKVRSELNDGWIRIFVSDNGIGISPEYHDRIFRVFERLHGVESYPGTGIGLAIVRKSMDKTGGRVGLESKPNEGTTFWIELPEATKPKEH